MDNLVSTIMVPSVTSFAYTYDANKRKVTSVDGVLSGQNQVFTYDDEDRLTDWTASSGANQDWDLSLVGDWNRTTGQRSDGQALTAFDETRSHNAVHEITSISDQLVTPIAAQTVDHDAKGNLTANPQRGQGYAWDVDNRLRTAGNPGSNLVADYRYDALGRRVGKTVRTGAAPDFASTTLLAVTTYGGSQDQSGAATASMAGNALTLTGNSWKQVAIAPYVLTPQTRLRVTFKAEAIGEIQGIGVDDNNGISWDKSFKLAGTQGWGRHSSQLGIPVANSDGWTTYDLPVGTYVTGTVDRLTFINDDDSDGSGISHFRHVVLYEDTASGETTTHYLMSGAQVFTERVNGVVETSYVYGAYVDEPVEYVTGAYIDEPIVMIDHSNSDSINYYHVDHRFSVAAITDSTGAVKERYIYSAYGERTVVVDDLSLEQVYGHTGRRHDDETGLQYFRVRYYEADLGRFLGRDPYRTSFRGWVDGVIYSGRPASLDGYQDGYSLYGAYFAPNHLDPSGTKNKRLPTPKSPDRVKINKQGIEGSEDASRHTANDPTQPNMVEYCGSICKDCDTGDIFRTSPARGTSTPGQSSCNPSNSPCPRGSKTVGVYHSHTQRSNYGPSSQVDIGYAMGAGIPVYTGRGAGHVERVNPKDGSVKRVK